MDKEEKRERLGGAGKRWWEVKKKKEKKIREPHTRSKHCGQRSSEHGVPVLRLACGRDLAGLREENPGCAEELRGGRGPQINHRLKA